ncbi:superoxide dismutase [Microbacterium aurantiacum]|uniref:Superoxide dismutase n=1 Tax=Microbacterium aurantiacum TaxID=162393 RepID=A0AAJ2LW60_9MICO|nr:superoxide dismutase [Microbacterium aurantiacum]MBN9202505.1 superoxide dismutase [Microbacterium chocolatum]MDN4463430.1 superoxide dismutase [Microbacterium aurantiacum]MDS0245995.1 superoxide dismutase [Microbacterium aurantiacum]ODT11716.1 MAG: superoxide dismutase [Microbacterium sp. SCN 70-18]
MAKYTLPDLPYDFAALEPHISGKIMELHHDKHHQAYVTGANTALEQLAEARESGNLANVNKLEKDLAFNLGGHVNHSIFWTNLAPANDGGGGEPEGELRAAIDEFFGGFDKFKAHFTAAATGIQGSGWAVLSWDPIGEQLIIQQLFDQQSNTAQGTIPVFQLDMWEHAFYLDYLNVKADYVSAAWNIANWQNVAQRLDAARGKTAGLLVLS